MRYFLTGFLLLAGLPVVAQINSYLGDESALYAETKQVNQFFRRFNNEEDGKGVKYQKTDSRYRSAEGREKYLRILFDEQNHSITADMKQQFIKDVARPGNPQFLNFHGEGWFAEVTARFTWQGKDENAILYLKLEQENLGYKWVLTNVYFEPFARMFSLDTGYSEHFLHPMSHELDFMNLTRIFQQKDKLEEYTLKAYSPDYLTLFFYEAKKNNLTFKSVIDLKFHFFQIDNWYFEISEFNRSGRNRGWLISGLTRAPEDRKDMLRRYIFRMQ